MARRVDAERAREILGRNLEENQRVEYDLTQGQKGPQAANVRATT